MAQFRRRSQVMCCLLLVTFVLLAFPGIAYGVGITHGAGTAYGEGIQVETSPQVIRKTVFRGKVSSVKVKVTNRGSVPVEVVPEVCDLAIDEQGHNVEILDCVDYAWGLREFTSVSPGRFTLEPGEERIVDVTICTPGSLSGGRYGILYFAASDPSAKGRIAMVIRCGSLLFVTVPGTETHMGRIRHARFIRPQEPGGSAAVFEAVFENTGNVHMSATGHVRISNAGKTLVNAALKGGTGTILPGGVRLYRADFEDDMPDGVYKVKVTFAFEGKSVTMEKAFRIKGGQASFE